MVAGGRANILERNRVTGHRGAGILLEASVDGYQPLDNRVRDNVLARNRVDLAVRGERDLAALGNCFQDNRYARSAPAEVQAALPCGRPPRTVPTTRLALPPAARGKT